MKKVLIEESTVELLELFDKVSTDALREKRIVAPVNKLGYWWTKKPLVVGRAMALTSTLDNINDVKSLMGLDTGKSAYLYIPNKNIYKKKIGKDPKNIKILDPFGGSGNLVFPASELGLDISISDYNPVAYLIERATLEYPVKYGTKLVKDFEKYANLVITKTEQQVGKFFGKNVSTYIWCWCIKCPHCDQRFPLLNHMYIVKNPGKKIGIKIIPKNQDFIVKILQNISEEDAKKFTQKKGKAICISCTNSITYDELTKDISDRKDREMIVIQTKENNNRNYLIPTNQDRKLYSDAVKFFKSKKQEFEKLDLIPNENIHHNPRNPLKNYGITHWNEYFDERQLLVLCTFLKNINEIIQQIKDKEYRGIIATYLTFILTQRVNMGGFGVVWYTGRETPVHILTFRQPIIAYNFAESNPFFKSRGSFRYILDNAIKAISFDTRLGNTSKCSLESVTNTSNTKYDLIITDPPYGDDVQYAELSEFFYVWMYRALRNYYPELPSRVLLDEDFCVSWGRFENKKLAFDFFAKGLKQSFISMNQKLKEDGILVLFFANSSTIAWNLFLEAIRGAKFNVMSSYSIHTENVANVIARGKTSFMSSIIVVCRKQTTESIAYFEDILPDIEDKIKSMIDEIPSDKLLSLQITDLLIMMYGTVLEICTKFTELKSYKKDFKPDFETLIENSPSFIMKTIITKLTNRSLNTLGSLTAFYLITKIFHHGILSADDTIKITRTFGMNIDTLEKNNVGKNEGDIFRLIYLHENELDLKPEEIDRNNLHQQLCYLVQVSKKQGASKINTILSSKNFRIDDLKQLISLLLKSFRLRINKNEKLNDDEKEELQILEGISDVMGIKTTTKTKGGLDQYFED